MIEKRVSFKNKNDYDLSGIIHLPQSNPIGFALFAHCFTCSKNLKAVNHISNSLVEQNIGVLRFDFTGLGESEGDFSDTNFTSNTEDIYSACEFLRDQYESPHILIGHSLGGAAVLHVAKDIDSCKAVVTIGAPSAPEHVVHHFGNKNEKIVKEGVARVNIAGREFNIKKQFLEDVKKQKLLERVKKMGKALLIFHSPFDNIVGIDNASEIFLAAKHPKSFISLDKADHLLSNSSDSSYAAGVIASWAKKYISKDDSTLEETMDLDGYQVGVETYENGYFSKVFTNDHVILADEPETYGGTNKGPTPYDLLLASLGACTNMTLRMYADRKKIVLEKIITKLTHKKIHAEDCKECESTEGKVDVIDREIELIGNFTEEQKVRMGEIADKCPVHRSLRSENIIKTKVK